MTQGSIPARAPGVRATAPQDPTAPGRGGLSQRVADAVLAHPDVVRLSGGTFGSIATYLPGRRLVGVVLGDGEEPARIGVVLRLWAPRCTRRRTCCAPSSPRETGARRVDVVVADVEPAGRRAVTTAGRRGPTTGARRAFRAFARRHHPDVGGDPETFRRGVEAFRAGRSPFEAVGADPGRDDGTVAAPRPRRGRSPTTTPAWTRRSSRSPARSCPAPCVRGGAGSAAAPLRPVRHRRVGLTRPPARTRHHPHDPPLARRPIP